MFYFKIDLEKVLNYPTLPIYATNVHQGSKFLTKTIRPPLTPSRNLPSCHPNTPFCSLQSYHAVIHISNVKEQVDLSINGVFGSLVVVVAAARGGGDAVSEIVVFAVELGVLCGHIRAKAVVAARARGERTSGAGLIESF